MGIKRRLPMCSVVVLLLFAFSFVGACISLDDIDNVERRSPDMIKQMNSANFDYSTKVWIYLADKRCESPSLAGISDYAASRRGANGIKTARGEDYDVCPEYVEEIGSVIAIHTVSRWLNAISVSGSAENILQICNSKPFVKECRLLAVPSQMEVESYSYGFAAGQIQQLNLENLHKLGHVGQGSKVAILDTGYDLSHPVFSSLDVGFTWDFIHNNSDVGSSFSDAECGASSQKSHGTGTMSCLAGLDNGTLVGGAPASTMFVFQTECVSLESPVEEDYYVAALEKAESMGADIVSSSLGYNDWYSSSQMDGKTCTTTKAVNIATDLGLIVVTSAGNEGHGVLTAPGDAFDIISVGAITSDGQIASFSSSGPTADGRTKPEVVARGSADYIASPGGAYRYASGTSFSCPLTAGLVSAVLSAKPGTPMQVMRAALLEGSDLAFDQSSLFGYGLPDAVKVLEYLKRNASYPFFGKPEINVVNGESTRFHESIDGRISSNNTMELHITAQIGKLDIQKRNDCVVSSKDLKISMVGSVNEFNKALQYLEYNPVGLLYNTTEITFELVDGVQKYTAEVKIHTGAGSSEDEENLFQKYMAVWIVAIITLVLFLLVLCVLAIVLIGTFFRQIRSTRRRKISRYNPYVDDEVELSAPIGGIMDESI